MPLFCRVPAPAGQVVITLDKDFGELLVVRRQPHAGIVRLVGLPTAQQAPVAAATLTRYVEELGRGALVTAESGRTRVRRRPPPPSLRCTCHTSGTSARDSASSRSSRSSMYRVRSPIDVGPSMKPSAISARRRKRRAWSFIHPA